jgi:hypothetical protein
MGTLGWFGSLKPVQKPAMNKGKLRDEDGDETAEMCDIPDGIIAHLTKECGGNVRDRHLVNVTSGSFENEIYGANPHSEACENKDKYAPKNAVD